MPLWQLCTALVGRFTTVFGALFGSSTRERKQLSPQQHAYEEQRNLANADRFVSNGILVETVHVEGDSELDLMEQGGGTNQNPTDSKTERPQNPYDQRENMTVLMEPCDE